MGTPVPGRVATNQSAIFQRLRLRLFRNTVITVFQSAPLRLATILFSSVLVWAGVFAASSEGFHYLHEQRIPFAGGIIGTMFDILFLALGVMLIFSTSIILFSSLFSAPETRFLLSTPAVADQVFAYRFHGAVAFSSYAFVLLGSPILLGYGWMYGVPWYFYVMLPLFFLGYILLPGSAGALLCLLAVNYLPRKPKQLAILAGSVVSLIVLIWGYRMTLAARDAVANPDALQRLFGYFTFSRNDLLPSHWMGRGLLEAARGNGRGAFERLALVWSQGLFAYLAAAYAAKLIYRRGFNRLATGDSLRRRYGGHWMDRILNRAVQFLHPQTRLLIVKDFRTFRRDPAQWGQILIFAGLLVFYTANTRRFYSEELGYYYQSGVSLLNLTATAFLLCAYTGRFIYPLLSLEGRKFWILGLLPLQRNRLLWGKFGFSAAGALVIAEMLVVGSDLLLGISPLIVGLHAVTVFVLAIGLSGLSVGLGACMPNFRESDPSKIAVGFGGTLNLIVGLLFVLTIVGTMALPSHVAEALSFSDAGMPRFFKWLIPVGLTAGVVVGIGSVAVPLRAGSRTLENMEF
jgi:ABC-2 type transport system permease protein